MFSVTRVFSTTTNNKSALEKASAVKLPLLQRVLSVRKVARVNSGGKVRSTSALVVVGDMNGNAGYGMGRGNDTISAVLKATEQAKKNMKSYLRLDNRTINSDVEFKYHNVTLQLRTARPGYGIVANNNIHEVMRCVGISDLYCKIQGSTNPMNVIKAAFAALDEQKQPSEIARMRGKKVIDVEMTYYGTAKTV